MAGGNAQVYLLDIIAKRIAVAPRLVLIEMIDMSVRISDNPPGLLVGSRRCQPRHFQGVGIVTGFCGSQGVAEGFPEKECRPRLALVRFGHFADDVFGYASFVGGVTDWRDNREQLIFAHFHRFGEFASFEGPAHPASAEPQ
ncbi:hypothetical protein D3C81_1693600 [compost metagenome]